jgi:hypothetical protein
MLLTLISASISYCDKLPERKQLRCQQQREMAPQTVRLTRTITHGVGGHEIGVVPIPAHDDRPSLIDGIYAATLIPGTPFSTCPEHSRTDTSAEILHCEQILKSIAYRTCSESICRCTSRRPGESGMSICIAGSRRFARRLHS